MLCQRFIFPLLLMIVFIFNACGVSTSSSGASSSVAGTETNTTTGTETNTTTGTETNTTTGTETNTTTGSETNTTTGSETNTTTGSETNTSTVIVSIFETDSAQLDVNACGASGYTSIQDSSLDPEGFLKDEDGLKILSVLPISFFPKQTEVSLYYPELTQTLSKSFSVLVQDSYWISYDKAWVDNTNKTMYVKIPTDVDEKYICERLIIDSTQASSISATKVYRETN